MKVKKFLAVTTISTVAAAGLANAQSTSSQISQPMSIYGEVLSLFKGGKNKETGMHSKEGREKIHAKMQDKANERRAIQDAIISGNYTQFLQVASTSPLKDLSEEKFNLLTPQFQAKKNAEDQIRAILTSAGVKPPVLKNKPV